MLIKLNTNLKNKLKRQNQQKKAHFNHDLHQLHRQFSLLAESISDSSCSDSDKKEEVVQPPPEVESEDSEEKLKVQEELLLQEQKHSKQGRSLPLRSYNSRIKGFFRK